HEKPVPLLTVLAIIGTPLVLILAATFSSIALDPSTLRSVIEFFGNPFVALTIALFLAYYLLGIRRGWSRKSLESVSTSSLKPVGNILLVVGAGGIFGAVLKGSGIADALADTFNDVGLPVILLAWLISVVLRVAQGSATVAIVTTAGIVVPLVEGQDLSQAHLALIIMAISAGSIFASHVNDGGFWMVSKYFGISERDTLKSWTVLETVLSVAGFVVAALLSLVI
ncbi:GntP family permease, partial [Streptomyces sp. SID7982]|nr:GntP family permease [Streptomyces sp. SID7982]